MHDRLTESEHYEKPRLSSTAFVVKHYADKVAYEVASFMEKNKVRRDLGLAHAASAYI